MPAVLIPADVKVSPMALPDNLDLTTTLAAVGVLVVVMWLVVATLRRGSGGPKPVDQLAAVQAERDVLRANHAVEIAALEAKLAEAHSRVQEDMGAALRHREAEHARDTATARADTLEREVREVTVRLETAQTALQEAEALSTTARNLQTERDALEARLTTLEQTLTAAQETIGGFEADRARDDRPSSEEIATLNQALAGAQSREATANASLSRLAYDRDGMQSRIDAAERSEREARANLDKRDTQLELRQQKIYALEADLSDAHQRLNEVGQQGSGASASAMAEELAAAREHIDALSEALKEAQTASDTPPPQASDADIAALKEAIRGLADRFLEMAEKDGRPPLPQGEQSLADKIRAYKANRNSSAGPANPGPSAKS